MTIHNTRKFVSKTLKIHRKNSKKIEWNLEKT